MRLFRVRRCVHPSTVHGLAHCENGIVAGSRSVQVGANQRRRMRLETRSSRRDTRPRVSGKRRAKAAGLDAALDVLSGYVRRSDLFRTHAGSGFL
jgi:hypothetical protein